MEERKGKERKECSFSVFQGGFSLSRRRKKSSGFKGRRKEKKDEVLGLEDGIFKGRLEEGREGRKEGRRPCKMGVSQGPHFTHLFCFLLPCQAKL